MSEDKEDISSAPLTEYELRALRRIIISESRAAWLWASVRIWAGWIVGAPVAVFAAYSAVQKLFGVDVK